MSCAETAYLCNVLVRNGSYSGIYSEFLLVEGISYEQGW